MPGRTVYDAYRAFIDPIEAAVACLGQAKVVPSPGGMSNPNGDHSWNLGVIGGGMVFTNGYCFRAGMAYRYLAIDGGYRVTTLSYTYSLLKAGHELWAMHWHPDGVSDETRAHLHLNLEQGPDAKQHLPSGRMTFEDAVEWVIRSGVSPAREEDWQQILAQSKEVHVTHRTWHGAQPSTPSAS